MNFLSASDSSPLGLRPNAGKPVWESEPPRPCSRNTLLPNYCELFVTEGIGLTPARRGFRGPRVGRDPTTSQMCVSVI